MRRHPVVFFLSGLILAGQVGQTCLPVRAEDGPPDLNFKVYSPPGKKGKAAASANVSADQSKAAPAAAETAPATPAPASGLAAETPVDAPLTTTDTDSTTSASTATDTNTTDTATTDSSATTATEAAPEKSSASSAAGKTLQGYIRVVPSGTKIPIIMDTAVDSDTSQEGDEFAARTGEDLNIDGSTIVPAGSVIKGRIAQLNAPKSMNRSGSVGLKFDTVTTPDNRQIPIVANLVARGGVVHARRGMKDVAIDCGTMAVPSALGVGIGVLAGNASTTGLSAGSGAIIGAAVGAGVGLAVLMIKKGKKVDVRPGDELKIELAEDLRMPM